MKTPRLQRVTPADLSQVQGAGLTPAVSLTPVSIPTAAIDWAAVRPQPLAMTAEILLDDHPEGTAYRAVVRHGDSATRAEHETLGFADGWGAVTAQLAALVERAG